MRILADIRYSESGELEVQYYEGLYADSSGALGIAQAVLTDWVVVAPAVAQEPATIAALFTAVKLANSLVVELEAASNV